MEQFLLSCLHAQMMIKNVNNHPVLTDQFKSEIIFEVKKITKKSCFVDAKAD
jgi:hypothetical protein